MLGHNPFYHQTIRKYVTLFGSMFNDIFYIRETADRAQKERQKVPITYSPKERFITRLRSDPTLTKSINTTVPRMSFEMTSIGYDPTRKQQSTIRHRSPGPVVGGKVQSQYMGTPYNFTFSLAIYVRNIEDGLQIVEQILPFFLPDYTISAYLSSELEIIKDVPIVLNSVTNKIDVDGDFSDHTLRMVTWDLEFTMKGYLFGPVSNTSIIMGIQTGNTITGGVYTNIYNDVNNKTLQKVVLHEGTVNFSHQEPIREPDRNITGSVYSWDATTNVAYFAAMTGVLRANDSIWGLESGAHWIVESIETVNRADATIHIYQNPITANAETDFGYTTVITEFPNT